jgi:hypothetical protein
MVWCWQDDAAVEGMGYYSRLSSLWRFRTCTTHLEISGPVTLGTFCRSIESMDNIKWNNAWSAQCHLLICAILAFAPSTSYTFSALFGLRKVINAQTSLGWQAFFEGCVACNWVAIQHRYHVWIGSWRSR